jgi:hypothetical protein
LSPVKKAIFIALKMSPVFFIFLFPYLGCNNRTQESSASQRTEIAEIGRSSAMVLMKDLKTHLMQALENNDILEAFEACASIAQPLTADVEEKLPRGVKIKRTSFKYRNPENAPDKEETAALRYFEQNFREDGKLPANYIQRIEEKGKYRYYEPLTVSELCLKCHGNKAGFDPEVRQSLDENYPDDRATGYELGDFRGLIRVSIPESLATEK